MMRPTKSISIKSWGEKIKAMANNLVNTELLTIPRDLLSVIVLGRICKKVIEGNIVM